MSANSFVWNNFFFFFSYLFFFVTILQYSYAAIDGTVMLNSPKPSSTVDLSNSIRIFEIRIVVFKISTSKLFRYVLLIWIMPELCRISCNFSNFIQRFNKMVTLTLNCLISDSCSLRFTRKTWKIIFSNKKYLISIFNPKVLSLFM